MLATAGGSVSSRWCVRALLSLVGAASMACRGTEAPRTAACTPTVTPEVWVERHFPASRTVTDTARASLAVGLGQSADSLDRLPPGVMVSLLIAGPATAERPDTVRLITAEQPDRAPLWRGDQVRPGSYVASLTTQGYDAGPRSFTIAPGERVEMEVKMRHVSGCTSAAAPAR